MSDIRQASTRYGQPAEFTESSTGSDGAVRTTTQTYRPDGQALRTHVEVNGLEGSTSVDDVERLYGPLGFQDGVRSVDSSGGEKSSIHWSQDLWGRTTSYTNSLGETTTTEYDAFGNVSKTVSPKSTNTYKYGALSGDGTSEYQGVVTSMTVSNHGGIGQTGTYTATYDADGNVLTQGIPGGFTKVQEYDESGKPTRLSYTGPVKDENGNVSTGTGVSWQTVRDVTGKFSGKIPPMGMSLPAPEQMVTAECPMTVLSSTTVQDA